MNFFENRSSGIAAREASTFSYMPHLHESIELVYVEKGSTEINIEGKTHIIQSNSVAIVFPFQIHSYKDNDDNASGYIMFCSPSELLGLKKEISNSFPVDPIIKNVDEDIKTLINKITNECCDNANQKFTDEICKGYALALFGKVVPLLTLQSINNTNLTTTQILLNYCYKNFKEPLTLEQLSKELNINKFYISHIFNNKLNMGFTDYLAVLRVNEAKKLLKQTETSITNIAYDVGFSTIRSFNRRFKEFCGITPKEYRLNSTE